MARHAAEHDVIGIGFGPSNLALAIALDEASRQGAGLDALFVERQPRFTWHGGMLLPGSDMQISFLKDLVSLRDPTSPLTFINYLHKKGRLEHFANCRTFYPSRIEFNDYLGWVAGHFADRCAYGETIVAVEPDRYDLPVRSLRVISRTESGREVLRRTRNIVVAVGGMPHVPAVFATLGDHPRLIHSSRYLDRIGAPGLAQDGARIAVIGGGQSAVEITVDLHDRFPGAAIDLVFRGHALKPSDSSPFVNEIFHPGFTDFIYDQPGDRRAALVQAFRNTNYAVVDPDLLETLYRILYQQRVEGGARVGLMPRSRIDATAATNAGIAIDTTDLFAGTSQRRSYDAVVLATGYERSTRPPFLEPILPYLEVADLDRTYRIPSHEDFEPHVYLQGAAEASHGLSDTLLSVLAVRSEEISRSLCDRMRRAHG
ncbi:lysine N(6)-hydroxylase/L-ornithine N(5)-oxygenase family protein [Methylobacterium aquaticum]|jgi:L-ornithine N5-oxygenase|uniref:Ornithine monooxygenase n=1 Tax=Methylobacterium aquaticum TaxID=270351 RepID=A0A0J6VQH5_9HYPH|nr:lysine N(6)-hydroxylase/L-ornithine N(5)-oxygenase family protein [Methylobacterium aquaticum]KMO41476.1 ornithine monooxygenase [Methylobacterium aquaticum]